MAAADPFSLASWSIATIEGDVPGSGWVGSTPFAAIDGCQFAFLDAGASSWVERDLDEPPAVTHRRGTSPPTTRQRPTSASLRQDDLVAAATVYLRARNDDETPDAPEPATGSPTVPITLLDQLHATSPRAAERLAEGMVRLPEPGDEFLDFRIIEELGRGTFGRVFLAQQGELARRHVALKVTAELPGESQTLAQLQHTNIVPIFSVHHSATLHAVCMPYFGRATLADLLEDITEQGSLPSSGQVFARMIGSRQTSSRPGSFAPLSSTSVAATASGEPRLAEPASAPLATIAEGGSETLRDIGNLSYVNAVVWITARIAAGLAHAHKRGILHRDLKPANVLLTDDGQPMILDFNLSEDIKGELGAATASVGGTLRYMSPEHIERFLGRNVGVDLRSDLFALGIMLHELLTGQSPFPVYADCSLLILKRMIEDRHGEVVPASRLNPAVTPALVSIIRTCLQPAPGRRYDSADQLQEDLERHLVHLPLRHAPDLSPGERARKWIRRHPRLGSTTTAAVLVGACLLGLISMLVVRGKALDRLQATQKYSLFCDDLTAVRFLLNHRNEPDQRRRGQDLARRALGRYAVLDDPGWVRRPAVSDLAPEAATQLRADVAEVLLMMTQVVLTDAEQVRDIAAREKMARSARRLNQLALTAMPEGARAQAFAAQRAALARLLEGEAEGARLAAEADKLPLVTARDFYLAATGLGMRGEYRRALPLAEEAVRLDPQHFWAYFVLGFCHEKLGAAPEAMACFTTCTALRPDFADSWFNRGYSYQTRDDHDRARADFDRAVRLRPTWSEPYMRRGMAFSNMGDHLKAHNDFTRALELGAPPAKAYFHRSAERRALGDNAGAEADRREAMKHEPTDAPTWVSRGMGRVATDAPGALADFEAALRIDPNMLEALQWSASLLGGMPGRDEDAVRVLDRAVVAHPDNVTVRSGRGVHLAILGRRDEAHRDARESLWRDTRPAIQYLVAGIYATTSKTHAEDRAEAYRLLGTALRAGYGFDLIDEDHELDAIRDQPEFHALIASAREQSAERLRRVPGIERPAR